MDMEDAISYVLRIGVISSIFFIAVGSALLLVNNGSNGFTLNQIANANTNINSSDFTVPSIMNGLLGYQGLDWILIGLIVLIATPVMRVVMSIFAFAYKRNWLYATITLIVFIDLMIAVFIVPGFIMH